MIDTPRRTLAATLTTALLLTTLGVGAGPSPVPAEALAALRVDPGLRVELVAAEPAIQSPVAIAFGEDGRLWVVEMRDYPHGPAPGRPPEGRITILDDRDGDGRFEAGTTFADGLLFANGVLPWRGGALVTAAPSILSLQDTDGDGKADRREALFEGFAALNPQLRVSHPTLGLDGRVYVANGLRGGAIRRAGVADAPPIDLGGMDFRFDPRTGLGEAVSGMGQFGLTFDDWGRRFVCDNRHHLRHVVLPVRSLRRNPLLAVPDVLHDVPEAQLGEGGAGARLFPLSRNWTTSSLHTGRFTAASGVFIYRGDLLPESYRGAAFTCDPTGNLVHEERLAPDGATFRSRPARDGAEFLASPDDRFRPVALALGPDGALYVVDMARAVIEHPEFMPEELKNRPDLLAGKDHGRIWRIVPATHHGPTPRPDLGRASTAELVGRLDHPNAWWRTTAQRLLLERGDPATPGLLRAFLDASSTPLGRLHAAWLMESLGALEDDRIAPLLRAEQAGLRENAVALAGARVATSATLRDLIVALAGDPDPRVRFEVALALGAWDDDRIVVPLARIALAGADDRWTRLAVASAVPGRAGRLIVTLLQPPLGLTDRAEPGRLALLRELTALVGSGLRADEVVTVLDALLAIGGPDALRWQAAGLGGLAEGIARRGSSWETFLTTTAPAAGVARPRVAALAARTGAIFGHAAEAASDPARDRAGRLGAIALLAHAPWPAAGPALAQLVEADPDQEIRLATIRALSGQTSPEVGAILVTILPGGTPTVRREALAALLRRPERVGLLLDAVEAGRVRPGDLDAAATNQLLNGGRPELRARARTLLKASLPDGRRQVIERYRGALDLSGDPRRGREVFRKNCATCHRVAGVGVDVGPDIADTRTKSRAQLLTDILNPNGAIDGNYLNYVVSTRDGQVFHGLIAAESATSLTLRRAEGQADVVLRREIEEIRSTGASLMPEGLETTIPPAAMADLLTFLKDWRYREGGLPPSRDD